MKRKKNIGCDDAQVKNARNQRKMRKIVVKEKIMKNSIGGCELG